MREGWHNDDYLILFDRSLCFRLRGNIALQAFELPAGYPNDPADRIIGATALIEDVPLVTADREIHKSRVVPTIW